MAEKQPMDVLIYGDLVKAVDGICQRTFIERRPKTLPEEIKNFIVIQLPAELYGTVAGSFDFQQMGNGVLSIFSKAKTDGTLNVNAHSALVQKVVDLFCIRGEHVTANIIGKRQRGEDGYGYQYTEIYFGLRTKVNTNTK